MATEFSTLAKKKVKKKLLEPKKYKIVFHNDNVTPMSFVVDLLVEVFKHSVDSATSITITIHNEGSGVAGIYNFEIAEQKLFECVSIIKSANVPLKITMEEE